MTRLISVMEASTQFSINRNTLSIWLLENRYPGLGTSADGYWQVNPQILGRVLADPSYPRAEVSPDAKTSVFRAFRYFCDRAQGAEHGTIGQMYDRLRETYGSAINTPDLSSEFISVQEIERIADDCLGYGR
jgi:hypothetical protein